MAPVAELARSVGHRLGQAVTDESSIGVWLWLVLIVEINATWILMDLWLRHKHHEYLTTEFREGLKHPIWGPVLCFLVAGTVAAFVWHFYNTRDTAPRG